MTLSATDRDELSARLRDIQENRPIDNVQMERALLALLHAVLAEDETASRETAGR